MKRAKTAPERKAAELEQAQPVSKDFRKIFPNLRQRAFAHHAAGHKAELLEDLRNAYQHRGLVLYIGAGASRSIGLPSWPELIRNLTIRMMTRRVESAISHLEGMRDEQRSKFLESVSDDLGSQEIEQKPILMLARSIKDQMGSDLPRAIGAQLYRRGFWGFKSRQRQLVIRKHLARRTTRRFSRDESPRPPSSDLVDALVALARAERDSRGVQAIVNYNYDDLLEENLRYRQVRCTTVLSGSQKIPDGSLPVYHVHGLVSVQDYADYFESDRRKPMVAKGNFVFSEDEYHSEYSDPYKWSNMTQISHMGRYIGLFVGLSMQDPNLRRLIDVTHKQYPENYNFAILPRQVSLASSTDSKQTVLRNMFEEVETQSFERIGVRVLWVDSYDEIALVLKSVVSPSGF